MTDGIPGIGAAFLWASRGPPAGAEGLLDVLAGDLVAVGYAVGVDGEQDTYAVPGAGSDYVLCAEPRGGILAVVEAKDESHAEEAGLQQALAYAVDLGAQFAYSSNGHGIVEQDLRTGRVRQLQAFPTPGELRQRFEAGATWRGATVTGRSGGEVPNPLLQSAFTLPGAPAMRLQPAIRAGRHQCAYLT